MATDNAAHGRAMTWARNVEIELSDIPADVRKRVKEYFRANGRGLNTNGTVAFCRHNYTNYETLLETLRNAGDGWADLDAKFILRQRTDIMIRVALKNLKKGEQTNSPQ